MSTPTSATDGKTAVILGASGAVGKPLLSLLCSPSSPYSTVYSFARRPHPSPPSSPNVDFKEVIIDFEALHSGDPAEISKLSSMSPASSIFITMGTTKAAAGSMAAFERIDRGYVLSSARALAGSSPGATLLYCSSGSSSSGSMFPYLKSKGLTEEGLAGVFDKCVILRPGFLGNANRDHKRLLEEAFAPVMKIASRFSDSLYADVGDVAKAMLRAAQVGPGELKRAGLGTEPGNGFKLEQGKTKDGIVVVDNASVLKLARQS